MQLWSQGKHRLELIQGDIARQSADAIVNAANRQLAGGGGVDGAIHRRGGPTIMAETRQRYPNGCQTGSAVISSAGQLDARYVIHAVGPVWSGGDRHEANQLRSAYHSCLSLAQISNCKSVALPSLSTGAYRYPIDQASRIGLATCVDFLLAGSTLERVMFVLFDEPTLQTFAAALAEIAPGQDA